MEIGKRHQAAAGSPEARVETISVSVTAEVMAALKRATQTKKEAGLSWSVNREAWERLSYTFDLTGVDGEIEPHVKLLKSQGNRSKIEFALLKIIRETDVFPGFRYPGIRNALAVGTVGAARQDDGVALTPDGELDVDLLFAPVGDVFALRSRNSDALATLLLQTTANVSDSDHEHLKMINDDKAVAIIDRLFGDLRNDLEKFVETDSHSDVARMRMFNEAKIRGQSIQVLASSQVLASYLRDWNQVIGNHVDRLELLFDEPDFESKVTEAAAAAIEELKPINEARKMATVGYKARFRNITEARERVLG